MSQKLCNRIISSKRLPLPPIYLPNLLATARCLRPSHPAGKMNWFRVSNHESNTLGMAMPCLWSAIKWIFNGCFTVRACTACNNNSNDKTRDEQNESKERTPLLQRVRLQRKLRQLFERENRVVLQNHKAVQMFLPICCIDPSWGSQLTQLQRGRICWSYVGVDDLCI